MDKLNDSIHENAIVMLDKADGDEEIPKNVVGIILN